MAESSNVSIEIELNQLSILPGAQDLAKRGFITRANKTNREFSRPMTSICEGANEGLLEMVFDPQTSGGLLMSVPRDQAEGLVEHLSHHEGGPAKIVGSVQERQDHVLNIR